MINVFTELKTNKNFSSSERSIADYILQHPYEVLNMSTQQLSNACFTSNASIYRLCDKLNLSGFSDLKVRMSNSVEEYVKNNTDFDFDFPVKQHQTEYEIIQKLKEDYEQTVSSTAGLFDLDELKHIAYAMSKAKHIELYTSAGNIYFAQNFKFQMKEIGVEVEVPTEEYQQRLYASSSDETHLAIIISFGGRGMLVDRLVKSLRENNTPIVLICSSDAKMKFDADYKLFISSHEDHYKKISSFSTRLSILYILDVLYTTYFELDYDKNLEKKIKYYQILSEHSV